MRFLAKVTVTPPEKKIVFFNKNKTAIKNIKTFLFSSVTVTFGAKSDLNPLYIREYFGNTNASVVLLFKLTY